MNHGQWLDMWSGYAKQLNDRDIRTMARKLGTKPAPVKDSYCSLCASEGNSNIADDKCCKCKKNVCFDHCSSDAVCFDCIDKMNRT